MARYTIPPLLKAIIADANRVAPNRSHASDGTIGDLRHQQTGGDHNPDGRGIVHAADVTNDPGHGMNTWFWAQVIAGRMKSGAETRFKYLVSNDGSHDKIFNPSVSMTWRNNNAEGGHSHGNHLHFSIKSGAQYENSTAPVFVGSNSAPASKPVPPPEEDMIQLVKGDQTDAVFITDGMHKRWLQTKFHVDQWLAPKPPIARQVTLAQATVDQIPLEPGTQAPPK